MGPIPRRRDPNARKGRMTIAERALLEGVDPKADIALAAKALAPVLRRTPEALRAAITDARERLVSRAGEYADLHQKAARVAASKGNSAPSEWALTHLVHDGLRVVDAPTREANDNRVLVNIVLPTALGGSKPLEIADSLTAELLTE